MKRLTSYASLVTCEKSELSSRVRDMKLPTRFSGAETMTSSKSYVSRPLIVICTGGARTATGG